MLAPFLQGQMVQWSGIGICCWWMIPLVNLICQSMEGTRGGVDIGNLCVDYILSKVNQGWVDSPEIRIANLSKSWPVQQWPKSLHLATFTSPKCFLSDWMDTCEEKKNKDQHQQLQWPQFLVLFSFSLSFFYQSGWFFDVFLNKSTNFLLITSIYSSPASQI